MQDLSNPGRVARRRTAAIVGVLRYRAERRGLSAGELAARLGWSRERLERVFAQPSEILVDEACRLCQELDLTMVGLLELTQDGREEVEN